MDANPVINTITFTKTFDEKDGSERRSSARGVNTPDLMVIKHQNYVDSQTKVPGIRHVVRIDRVSQTTEGKKYNTSCYAVLMVPEVASQTDIDTVVTTFRAAIASTNPNIIAGVLNSES